MTDESTRAKLARASRAVAEAGAALDDLNNAYHDVESAFQALRINVSASVRLRTDEAGFVDLAYRRTDAGWKLVIESIGANTSTTLLTRASRDLRLLAAAGIPRLLDRMVTQAEEDVARVAESAMRLRAFTQHILATREEP